MSVVKKGWKKSAFSQHYASSMETKKTESKGRPTKRLCNRSTKTSTITSSNSYADCKESFTPVIKTSTVTEEKPSTSSNYYADWKESIAPATKTSTVSEEKRSTSSNSISDWKKSFAPVTKTSTVTEQKPSTSSNCYFKCAEMSVVKKGWKKSAFIQHYASSMQTKKTESKGRPAKRRCNRSTKTSTITSSNSYADCKEAFAPVIKTSTVTEEKPSTSSNYYPDWKESVAPATKTSTVSEEKRSTSSNNISDWKKSVAPVTKTSTAKEEKPCTSSNYYFKCAEMSVVKKGWKKSAFSQHYASSMETKKIESKGRPTKRRYNRSTKTSTITSSNSYADCKEAFAPVIKTSTVTEEKPSTSSNYYVDWKESIAPATKTTTVSEEKRSTSSNYISDWKKSVAPVTKISTVTKEKTSTSSNYISDWKRSCAPVTKTSTVSEKKPSTSSNYISDWNKSFAPVTKTSTVTEEKPSTSSNYYFKCAEMSVKGWKKSAFSQHYASSMETKKIESKGRPTKRRYNRSTKTSTITSSNSYADCKEAFAPVIKTSTVTEEKPSTSSNYYPDWKESVAPATKTSTVSEEKRSTSSNYISDWKKSVAPVTKTSTAKEEKPCTSSNYYFKCAEMSVVKKGWKKSAFSQHYASSMETKKIESKGRPTKRRYNRSTKTSTITSSNSYADCKEAFAPVIKTSTVTEEKPSTSSNYYADWKENIAPATKTSTVSEEKRSTSSNYISDWKESVAPVTKISTVTKEKTSTSSNYISDWKRSFAPVTKTSTVSEKKPSTSSNHISDWNKSFAPVTKTSTVSEKKPSTSSNYISDWKKSFAPVTKTSTVSEKKPSTLSNSNSNWIESFAPVTTEELAVHSKKVEELQNWLEQQQPQSAEKCAEMSVKGWKKSAFSQHYASSMETKKTESKGRPTKRRCNRSTKTSTVTSSNSYADCKESFAPVIKTSTVTEEKPSTSSNYYADWKENIAPATKTSTVSEEKRSTSSNYISDWKKSVAPVTKISTVTKEKTSTSSNYTSDWKKSFAPVTKTSTVSEKKPSASSNYISDWNKSFAPATKTSTVSEEKRSTSSNYISDWKKSVAPVTKISTVTKEKTSTSSNYISDWKRSFAPVTKTSTVSEKKPSTSSNHISDWNKSFAPVTKTSTVSEKKPSTSSNYISDWKKNFAPVTKTSTVSEKKPSTLSNSNSDWIESFAPFTTEEVAVHSKKVEELQNWLEQQQPQSAEKCAEISVKGWKKSAFSQHYASSMETKKTESKGRPTKRRCNRSTKTSTVTSSNSYADCKESFAPVIKTSTVTEEKPSTSSNYYADWKENIAPATKTSTVSEEKPSTSSNYISDWKKSVDPVTKISTVTKEKTSTSSNYISDWKRSFAPVTKTSTVSEKKPSTSSNHISDWNKSFAPVTKTSTVSEKKPSTSSNYISDWKKSFAPVTKTSTVSEKKPSTLSNSNSDWIESFAPVTTEELAVHSKKVEELQNWLEQQQPQSAELCLITGPPGSGKTAALRLLAATNQYQLREWINPVDMEVITTLGDQTTGNSYVGSQLEAFKGFLLRASRYKSLFDSSDKRILLVEDFPNTFYRDPTLFEAILEDYADYGKSPMVFIVADSKFRGINLSYKLFSDQVKSKYDITHISFNPIATTLMQKAVRRFCAIMREKHSELYRVPTQAVMDSIVVTAQGDIRNALLNLHFASLKGAVSMLTKPVETERGKTKRKTPQTLRSVGCDESITMMHALGRVFNPKFTSEARFLHSPEEIADMFCAEPNKFIDLVHANYLAHFSDMEHVIEATNGLSLADILLHEYREDMLGLLGLNLGVRSVMAANAAPVSGWMPVRGAKRWHDTPPPAVQMVGPTDGVSIGLYVTEYSTFVQRIAAKIHKIQI